MRVKLIKYTENSLDLIVRMAHSTRKNYLEKDWEEKISQNDFVKELISWGHEGVFEHIIFTFHVSEVSRCLTHQLVRHRIASYLQQSSRHVVSKKEDYVIPQSVAKTVHETQHYKEWMEWQWDNYKRMINMGIPVEDARYLLPDGYFTHITLTMNCRELRHFFELRCDEHAQWEIREMAKEMLKICHEKYPIIFEDLYKKFMENLI